MLAIARTGLDASGLTNVELIEGKAEAPPPLVVDLGRGQVPVPQQLLHLDNIRTIAADPQGSKKTPAGITRYDAAVLS